MGDSLTEAPKRKRDPVERALSLSERDWRGKVMSPERMAREQPRTARWSELEGEDMARECQSVFSSLEVTEGWRRFAAMRNLRRIDARPVAAWGLPPTENGLDNGPVMLGEARVRLAKSMIETFIADVTGRGRPKPQFLTTGADWSLRRRARKLDKFVYGVMGQEQGLYHDVWEAMSASMYDAMMWGCGALKVYAGADRVRIDRTFSFDLFTDPQESRNGRPDNLFQLIPYNRDLLAAEFPEARDSIYSAARWSEPEAWWIDASSTVSGSRTADICKVIEAWCLPRVLCSGGDPVLIPGRHAIVCNGALLHVEEWDRPYFPFVITRWSPDPTGFWGVSLVDEVAELEAELNEQLIRMQERGRLLGNRRIYYKNGSIAPEHLQHNEAEVHIPYNGDAPPTVEKVDPFNDSDMEYLQLLRQIPYEICGISVQAATGRKDPGITSGTAIRSVADIGSMRQAPKARRMWEMQAVEVGKRIVDAVADLADRDPGFKVRFAGKGFLDEIAWKDVDMRRDEYMVQVAPASSLPQDPAGRLQMATDLHQSGLIGPAVFKRLLDWPDLESEQQRESAEFEYVEWVIDRYLDATEEQIADPMFYQSPEGFFGDLLDVVAHVAQAYFIAKREGAPELNLELLRRYIEEAQQLIKTKAQEQAAVATPNGPPPPDAMGMPGAPAGGPPAMPPG